MKYNNTVISTSWSLPLKKEAIEYLRENWYCVYIDTPNEVILRRMQVMKVERIIWMEAKINKWVEKKEALKMVLKERTRIYENCYDHKFQTDWLGTQKEIFEEFKKDFHAYLN